VTTETTSRTVGAEAASLHQETDSSIETFRAAFRHHPGGVSVVTAEAGHHRAAFTATSVTSVSLTPPMLAFSLARSSSSDPTMRAADTAVVHLLTADDLALARLCATSGVDRFADTSQWSRLPTGEPYFHCAGAWIRGKITGRMEAGGSTIVVLEALEVGLPAGSHGLGQPLVYHDRSWHRLDMASRLSVQPD
jgi:flavin reductase (DIM6/NTAB) family NADH-FMN oxidoreductase RutF